MKPSAGWAIFVAVMILLGWWMVFSPRSSKPPPELLPLELTTADVNDSDSCYSLGTLLAANHLDGSDSSSKVTWTQRVKDEWTMRVERGRSWSALSLQREADRLVPVRYAASDDLPQTGPHEAMAPLISVAANQGASRMAHCDAAPAATP